ncbi:hypothetical protein [Sphingobium yanoikuyae]|jgi:hypothetical protein|uniref:hypothetical protein n=1 Tax=Sphingobium yanoikuyae TaxID=13690 RepID=UPI0028DD152A|nr:hypothetical protein [Sphingobium yanoikuyae]
MQTVTFARLYIHKIDDLREAHYQPGTLSVSNEVAEAALKAGALEEENGERLDQGNRTGRRNQPKG